MSRTVPPPSQLLLLYINLPSLTLFPLPLTQVFATASCYIAML